MNTTNNLFIRACKSLNPSIRLESVYRRFYLKNDNPNPHITRILARICDDYNLCTSIQIIEKFFEHKRFSEDMNDTQLFFHTFLSFIRFANVNKFEDYRVPAMFRNKEN